MRKVMYGHHVATLGLVSLSYFNAWQPIGPAVIYYLEADSQLFEENIMP